MKSVRVVAYIVLLVAILGVGIARFNTKPKQEVMPPIVLPKPKAEETVGMSIPPGTTFPVTLLDSQGRAVVIKSQPKRIVSLSPGTTELLFDVGAGGQLVADTTACDWPSEAKLLPHIGGIFDMSLESILVKNPDLIIADGSVNQKMITTLINANQPVFVVQAKRFTDTYDMLRLLGRATGNTTRADAMVELMQTRMEAVKQLVSKAMGRRKVLIMYGFAGDGVYTTGKDSFIDDLITLSGGKNIALTNDPLSLEKVAMEAPEVIICDFSLRDRIKSMPGWATLPAVRTTSFFDPSLNATLVRPSPRNAQAAWELAKFLHPEVPVDPVTPAPSPASPTAPTTSGAAAPTTTGPAAPATGAPLPASNAPTTPVPPTTPAPASPLTSPSPVAPGVPK